MKGFPRCACLVLLSLAACSRTQQPSSAVQLGAAGIPTAASSAVGALIWQTDGLFGYRMLRPAEWDPANLGNYRGYASPEFPNHMGHLLLRAVNLQIYRSSPASETGLIATLALYEKSPTLDQWTKGIEDTWKNLDIRFASLKSVPNAKIYYIQPSGAPDIQMVAYAVSSNQPLAIDLTASGIYANPTRLQQDGILDDFAVMVASTQAIPQDPKNVDPVLK